MERVPSDSPEDRLLVLMPRFSVEGHFQAMSAEPAEQDFEIETFLREHGEES